MKQTRLFSIAFFSAAILTATVPSTSQAANPCGTVPGYTELSFTGAVRNSQKKTAADGSTYCTYQIDIAMMPEPIANPLCPLSVYEAEKLTLVDQNCSLPNGTPLKTLLASNGVEGRLD